MPLRDEIAALFVPEPDNRDELLRNSALRDVLALVDKHEAEIAQKLTQLAPVRDISEERSLGYRLGVRDAQGIITGRIKHIDEKPSEDRPARDMLKNMRGIGYTEYLEAIVEAIDANTAAIREARK